MSELKYINYDSQNVDGVAFDRKIESICRSSYRIDANQLFVAYSGSTKDLYENLNSIIEGKHILIIDVEQYGYYGYHDSNLWSWLREQYSVLL